MNDFILMVNKPELHLEETELLADKAEFKSD